MTVLYVLLGLAELVTIARAILRPHRDPASRVAWVVVIASVPVLGIVAYFLLGETSIGRRRLDRTREVISSLPPMPDQPPPEVPDHYAPLFRLAGSIERFTPVGGNRAHVTNDSNDAIQSLVRDIDEAQETVHLSFYIWLADHNGLAVAQALERAAGRGVVCRALADGLGSRAMIGSEHWASMREAGVRLGTALALEDPVVHPLGGRLDLRNHRKIVVIDGRITYCGSQNCADPEFRVKPRFAPWVDLLVRFEGPIALQNQYVFASDWMTSVDEDIREVLHVVPEALEDGFPAQVVATGPTLRASAMSEMFAATMHAARERLLITTPYYVPDDPMQAALCSAAHRGVDTTIIFPARVDSWVVAAASHSYYRDLLAAGVQIHEYVGGLLHTKSMTVDHDLSLIGSANMDRRSFDLNFENNILLWDADLTARLRGRQESYLERSRRVTLEEVDAWGVPRRLWNNAIGMLGPVL